MKTIDTNTVNPYIRVATRSVLSKGTVINRRVIFDYELIYIEDGEMTLLYDGTPYKCRKGDFILLRPSVPHSFEDISKELSQPHVHFDICYTSNSKNTPVSFKDFPEMSHSERALIQDDLFSEFPRTPFVSFSNVDSALKLFYEIIDLFSANQALAAKGVLTQLISELIKDNYSGIIESKSVAKRHLAQQIKDYIDSTNGCRISLDAMEKQFSYSKFHLEREFQKSYGISLVAYANSKKMELAQSKLESKSVLELSEELGFSSIYSFSRAFKNYFGAAPSLYRKLNTEKK